MPIFKLLESALVLVSFHCLADPVN